MMIVGHAIFWGIWAGIAGVGLAAIWCPAPPDDPNRDTKGEE